MVVMTESIVNVSRILSQCSIKHSVPHSRTAKNMDDNKICAAEQNTVPVVRSVAMSENIARSVRDEVKHFIHVESSINNVFPAIDCIEDNERDATFSVGKTEFHVHGSSSSVSYILPSAGGSILAGVVLSKWDDIMGPQTVHVWLRDEARSMLCHHPKKTTRLAKAVKYVTSHTVNYTGCNTNTMERSSSIFVVPELDLIAQSLVFQLRDHELNVPYSLAMMVNYQHYNYFLHLRQLCRHWLQRMAARLHVILLKCLSMNCAFEVSDQVNGWILDVCDMMVSLKNYGLAAAGQSYHRHMLNHPLLERILTSHLQTFGCTVVMGMSSEDINSLILFLALFLDSDELHCSRFVLPNGNCSFHAGLYLQGLLLNEFGCRELCSLELAANPYPVTAVDLTRGAVKQTPLHHMHLAHRRQMALREHRQLCDESDLEEPDHQLHESVLHIVKDGASLVCSLLEELRQLPPGLWATYIGLFRQKLDTLAFSLLNMVCWMRNECETQGFNKTLAHTLDLSEADFLIVLAVAEKMQPGVYSCVMGSR